MKIIISPAKKMNVDTDTMEVNDFPVFLERTESLKNWLQSKSFADAKALWGCNEKIAELNFERIQAMDLRKNLTPALLSYEGIQYQYMAPKVFNNGQWEYVQKHLRILSGFYGVLKPLDGVVPYRLEMQAKGAPRGYRDLYDFWNGRLYDFLISEEQKECRDPFILNLASKEYSRCIETYIKQEKDLNVRMVTCVFGELNNGKVVQKGTMAKMARGEMVCWLSEYNLTQPEAMKELHGLNYAYCPERSTEKEYVYLLR